MQKKDRDKTTKSILQILREECRTFKSHSKSQDQTSSLEEPKTAKNSEDQG